MNRTDAIAYMEILEILKYLPKEEYYKIPKEKIEFYEKNKDNNYSYKFDVTKTLNEQKVSRKTNSIIVSLFMEHFATTEQNKKIEIILRQNEERHQKELREKYNPDNIFENKQKFNGAEDTESTNLEKYNKKPWYKKIFEKINALFKSK